MNRTPDEVAGAADRVRQTLADAGGDPDRIRIVAVTKGHDVRAARVALEAGLVDLGENYAQELEAKATDDAVTRWTGAAPRWHFIGNLQSNKVRLVGEHVHCWQSVDRASLVRELARRVPGASVLVQVNATGEAGKGGAAPGDVPELVARARDAGLDVVGVMAVGRFGDHDATEAAFVEAARLADRLDLRERSFGMSGDLEAAVRAGTTMVRVGTALFGPRPR